jgi:hypothetical protein
MNKRYPERGRFWYLWPIFLTEKDARDVAKFALSICIISAVVFGIKYYYNFLSANAGEEAFTEAFTGILAVLMYSLLGYFIFKMSRIASVSMLLLYSADKIYGYLEFNDTNIGIGIIFMWYLLQSVRATFWYHQNKFK